MTHALVLLALALAGDALGAHARREVEADCRARLPDGAKVEVRGLLAANHFPAEPGGRTPLLPVAVREARVGGDVLPHCREETRVRLPRGAGPLLAGTELRLRGEWRRLPGPPAPSGWPRSPAYAGFLSARELEAVSPPRPAAHPFLALRGRMERQLHRLFPRHGPLADALLLGRRETLDRALADRFAKSGLVHLLAISGTHVALMGTVFLLLGRAARLSRTRTAWLTLALVGLYLAMIGAPPSALRAGVMMGLSLAAVVLQRPSATLPPVAAAALAILAAQPMAALDAGFQLS
ncbi:MAG TPA: ComEC/Rec2 family competence protein, partial [Longimicrobiaceae bacterium]|nr:ComEC/Rec2 family competence protein [Longimicrobiaceae bacterium]